MNMLEVNEENLLNWINKELEDMQIEKSEDEKMEIVYEALRIYENQILTLESRTEALDIMQGLTLAKLKADII